MGTKTRKRPTYMGMETHNIEEEIITDMLIMLPVKSLLRFKCVVKFWNALISEPNFKRKHLNFHAKIENSQKLLISQPLYSNYFYLWSSSLSSVQIVKDIQRLDWPLSWSSRVRCCYDGLFLIELLSTQDPMLILWNPSTREKTILPYLEYDLEDDLEEEYYAFGLGYDSTSDDYKILKVNPNDNVVRIHALKSGSWRKIDGTMSTFLVPLWEGLAFLHGAFHWLSLFPKRSVVTLNISNEMYGEIPHPEVTCPMHPSHEVGMSLLGGMLCFYTNDTKTTNLWVMKDYGIKESWTKLLSIPINGTELMPIYKFSTGEVLLSILTDESGTMIHKISEGSFGHVNRKWPLHSDGIDANTIQDYLVYTESLISPKLGH